jgi:hypothetical protein
MQEAGVISNYLEALADAIRFDRSLSRRVLQEVEDHLREVASADPTCDGIEAERRAIANFGDPHAIAAQFAALSLGRQARSAGAALILIIATVFVTMKTRVVWYIVTQWTVCEDVATIREVAASIDRYSFRFSVIVGIAGFAYIVSRRISPVLDAGYRKQFRLSFILCLVATASLAVSVVSDGVLTALQLRGTEFCAGCLVPILSMTIEVGGIGVLAFQIRSMMRRATSTAALLNA